MIRILGTLVLILMIQPALAGAPVLVDTGWLADHQNDPDLVVVDMSMDDTQYQRFHLPGAVRLPYQLLTKKRRDGVSLRHGDKRLAMLLGLMGISADKYVVIYDDMGGLQAARLFWELERIGHDRVSVLDGGLVKWILEGRKVTNEPVHPQRTQYQLPGGGRDNEADKATVQAAMGDGRTILLDVRSEQEYVGSPRMKRSGHIPGAKWWPWEQAVDFKQAFVAQSSDKLLASLDKLGVRKDTPVITYCQSGHRAGRAYMTLRRLGFNNVKLYDGSMAEWSIDRSLPLQTGK
jgi:thiosulfate/3-mercaptopyruvate sulfurtransferase